MNGWVMKISFTNVEFVDDGREMIVGYGSPVKNEWEHRGNELLERYGFVKNSELQLHYRAGMELLPVYQVIDVVRQNFPCRTRVSFYRISDANHCEVTSDKRVA